jgi:hypothetical protein
LDPIGIVINKIGQYKSIIKKLGCELVIIDNKPLDHGALCVPPCGCEKSFGNKCLQIFAI